MKSKGRIVIMLTYATAVFLCAKAQAGSTGITTQIMLAGIYLGPAVLLHFAINWLWGDETKATRNDDAGNNSLPLARNGDGSVAFRVYSE